MKEKKTCKYCVEEIHIKAKVCKHCGRNQNKWISAIKYINIISIIMLLLSILQYRDSKEERAKASEALDSAKIVMRDINIIKKNIDSVNVFIIKTGLLNIKNSWIIANNSKLAVYRSKQTEEFENNADEFLRLLIPDSIKREKWIKETEK